MSDPTAEAVAAAAGEHHLPQLLRQPNVIGVGVGYRDKRGKVTDETCVHVFVDRKIDAEQLDDASMIPEEIGGPAGSVRTDVVEVFDVRAQQDTTRYRPVPGGCSIGPERSTSAGTLGGFACDGTDDGIVLLSNNHVISNLDTLPTLRRIVQPGRLDGGTLPADVIGSLKRDVILNTVPNVTGAAPPLSVVDAAIGTIDVGRTDEIQQLGVPAIYELQAPTVGMAVQKRGRTTRLTTNGTIFSINVTTNITYANRTRLGRVQNAFWIRSTDGNVFSAAGDSGSLILSQNEGEVAGTFPVVGLLFGGGAFGDGTPGTIANDINSVFGALNLSTVCACIARALVRAIFGGERAENAVNDRLVSSKVRQLERFRRGVLDDARFGKLANAVITREAARVGAVLSTDDEAFGLLARALRTWVMQPTNFDIMEAEFDDDTVNDLLAFSKRIARRDRSLAPQFAAVQLVLESVRGVTVGQVVRSSKFDLEPIDEQPAKRPKRTRKSKKS